MKSTDGIGPRVMLTELSAEIHFVDRLKRKLKAFYCVVQFNLVEDDETRTTVPKNVSIDSNL